MHHSPFARSVLLAWCGVVLVLPTMVSAAEPWLWYGQSPDGGPGQHALQGPPPLAPPLGDMAPPLWLGPQQPPGPPFPPEASQPFGPATLTDQPVWQPADESQPKHAEGCGCPCCSGNNAPFHVHPSEIEQLPMFAPTELDAAGASWLPEVREAWYGRPFGAGAFGGVLLGDEIISRRLEMKPGWLTGLRFGGDYNNRWAWEYRVAYARPEVINLVGPELSREADLFIGESSLIYSRYATRRLRPYVSVGVGAMYLDTTDHFGQNLREFMTVIPVGVGLKYRLYDWMVFRFDARDNIALGDQAGLDVMHNVTLSGGLEFRFGGGGNTYYPWNPSRNLW